SCHNESTSSSHSANSNHSVSSSGSTAVFVPKVQIVRGTETDNSIDNCWPLRRQTRVPAPARVSKLFQATNPHRSMRVLVRRSRWILVRPREQGRLAKPPVADKAEGFVFLLCQMGRNRLRTSDCECRRLLYIFRFAWLLTPFSR